MHQNAAPKQYQLEPTLAMRIDIIPSARSISWASFGLRAWGAVNVGWNGTSPRPVCRGDGAGDLVGYLISASLKVTVRVAKS